MLSMLYLVIVHEEHEIGTEDCIHMN